MALSDEVVNAVGPLLLKLPWFIALELIPLELAHS